MRSVKAKTYSVGDQIILNSDYYYVIADSGEAQEHVVVLKAEPLLAEEINVRQRHDI